MLMAVRSKMILNKMLMAVPNKMMLSKMLVAVRKMMMAVRAVRMGTPKTYRSNTVRYSPGCMTGKFYSSRVGEGISSLKTSGFARFMISISWGGFETSPFTWFCFSGVFFMFYRCKPPLNHHLGDIFGSFSRHPKLANASSWGVLMMSTIDLFLWVIF